MIIQIDKARARALKRLKDFPNETYDSIIKRILKDQKIQEVSINKSDLKKKK